MPDGNNLNNNPPNKSATFPKGLVFKQNKLVPKNRVRKIDIGIQTIIGTELLAVLDQFGIDKNKDSENINGTVFYYGSISSNITGDNLSVVVSCCDEAGNANASFVAERTINLFQPSCMFLLGIAAGIRGDCKIGDVIFPQGILYNNLAVAIGGGYQKRVKTINTSYVMVEHLRPYLVNESDWYQQIHRFINCPQAPDSEKKDFIKNVAVKPKVHDSMIYSSDQLIKDPKLLLELKKINQQIRAGDMESAGFAIALTKRTNIIPWHIVRGVSDFGDKFKNDAFHKWASYSASGYLYLMIKNGINKNLL